MPYYRYQIETTLSPDEIIARIQAVTGEEQGFWESVRNSFRTPERPFLGKIENYSFKLRRDIRYRNSFLPQIRGQVQPSSTGSTISITMTLHPFVSIFMIFWLWMTGSAGWQSLVSSQTQSPVSFVLLGMFAFGVILALGGFYPEVIKARNLINNEINKVGT